MPFKVRYSERNAKTAAEFETKSLLYMIGKHKDTNTLATIFVDCFNDITGTNFRYSELYDMQSKGVAKLSPSEIGSSLVTLFLNFKSSFPFSEFAILTPRLKQSYLHSNDLQEFDYANFHAKTLNQIVEGLRNESIRREPSLAKASTLDKDIGKFLNMVRFVVDEKPKAEYVKAIVNISKPESKDDLFYESIFKDIRDRQSAKKYSNIHNAILDQVADALNFDRHLAVSEIYQLLAIRFAGVDLFNSKGIPLHFLQELQGMDTNLIQDILLDCRSKISKSFFDKNKQKVFWQFLECVLNEFSNDPNISPNSVYEIASQVRGFNNSDLSGRSGLYFIALIKEGLS